MEQRVKRLINSDWKTYFSKDGEKLSPEPWESVDIPHNHDNYHGYHKVSHGNLHGSAWYKKSFKLDKFAEGERAFVYFEGVGSYATVWLNGEKIGYHAGGRTTFTFEMTDSLIRDGENELLVLAEHPEKIMDLPWVCGGCFGTPNTEGSQPLGIFRPVSVYTTGRARINPFGVHILTPEISEKSAGIAVRTEIDCENITNTNVKLVHRIVDKDGNLCAEISEDVSSYKTEQRTNITNPILWDTENPYLYTVETELYVDGKLSDKVENTFGVRQIEWENFDNSPNEVVDESKLYEEPSEENDYFTRYTRGGTHSKVGVEKGAVRVALKECSLDNIIIGITATLINRDEVAHDIQVESFVQTYNETKSISNLKSELSIKPGEKVDVYQETDVLSYLDFWSEKEPTLHSVVISVRGQDELLKEYNQTKTSFRVYQKEDVANRGYAYKQVKTETGKVNRRLLINGKPVFINGTCEYEHLLGNDHAFYPEQIAARMGQMKAAGFNSLREAHCPHNLLYQKICDELGILFWAQMGAHLYFDTEEFRKNFLILTEEWVRERRNSPSVILWGIQNESMLPSYFTEEVKMLIRSLDETSPEQRKTCTCNGGYGSDWNVPQNWSGTYGRSVEDYGEEIIAQRLIGEYGQYRVLGKHEEGDMEQKQNAGGDVSEELFSYCMETKVRLAEENRDYFYGHYQWIFNSHANPGREVMFCLDGSGKDGVGVINSKGIISSWGEPVDAYYMFRSNYAPKETEPMVYIVSHTWPERFEKAGERRDVTVYSNCDEVELYNNATGKGEPLGKIKKGKKGTHFTFSDVEGKHNVFTAVGYVGGKAVAKDRIGLNNLPDCDDINGYIGNEEVLTGGEKDFIFRINCGGEDYTDTFGNVWSADRLLDGFKSWAIEYPEVDPELGSVRRTNSPIKKTLNQELFKTFRYGREKLSYSFPVDEGKYEINLYMTEPWFGIGGGSDCTGWRMFDVAVNGETEFSDVDIWSNVGNDKVLKLSCAVDAIDKLEISFPKVKSYSSIVNAIGIRKI